MKALKIIGIIIGIIILVVLILGLIAPKDVSISRSQQIDAPAEHIKNEVTHFKNFKYWSPWEKRDPELVTRIEGTDGQVGAKYYWEGNEEVGSGKQEIMGISDNRIDIQLTFFEPWESTADSYILLEENEAGTEVTWGFSSRFSFPWNVMGLFFDMDATLGPDYEEGLTMLKAHIEKSSNKAPASGNYEVEEVTLGEQVYLIKRAEVPIDQLSEFFEENSTLIYEAASNNGMNISGPLSGIYYEWNQDKMTTKLAIALPLDKIYEDYESGKFQFTQISGSSLQTIHHGSYDEIQNAHIAIREYANTNGITIQQGAPVIETYVVNPGDEVDAGKWKTRLNYLLD